MTTLVSDPISTVPATWVREVARGAFAIAPSCLGFGCASLGSRIGARAGLRALAEAHAAGVTWFDVAPAYGAGEAETILARFLAGRRDAVIVTTKVGIAPPQRLAAMKLAYGLGRPLIGAATGLRRVFRKVGATRNRRLPLDAALVERSIAASLGRLATDHVDVYALHDPDPEDVARDDILRALERVVARGQARQIAVAGKREACLAAARIGAPYAIVQLSTQDYTADVAASSGSAQRVVLHSVFGVDGMRDRLIAALAAEPRHSRALVEAGYAGDAGTAATQLLLDTAFALNRDGVVLTSMFGAGHVAANVSRASRPVSPDAPARLRAILDGRAVP